MPFAHPLLRHRPCQYERRILFSVRGNDSYEIWAAFGILDALALPMFIERRFCGVKQWHGLATLYDKQVTVYRASVLLHAAIPWTRQLTDPPWG